MTIIQNMTKEELGTFLSPLTDLASQMIIAGTLKKNVIRFFVNKGLPMSTAENLTEVAQIKAEQFMANKAK